MFAYLEYGLSYLVLAYIVLAIPQASKKFTAFACLNLAACYVFFFHSKQGGLQEFCLYLLYCLSLYYMTLLWRKQSSRSVGYLAAVTAPVIWLVGVKLGVLPTWIGISYMAFRLSYLMYEIEGEQVPLPTLSQFMGFAFFPPTLLIGPISPYRFYLNSVLSPDRSLTPLDRSLTRILLGIVKAGYFAQLCKALTFSVLWSDGYLHGPTDLIISSIASYLYLYLNFSGGCDVIIGISGILNIRVMENFNAPLFSRNLSEFWQRFNISLYQYLHDLVYLPLSLALARKLSRRAAVHGISIALLVTFILVGLWHGVSWNFLILGLLHGFGMIVCYYFGLMKRRFPARLRLQIDQNPIFHGFFVMLTFLYVSFTMFFFENNLSRIIEIWGIFRY